MSAAPSTARRIVAQVCLTPAEKAWLQNHADFAHETLSEHARRLITAQLRSEPLRELLQIISEIVQLETLRAAQRGERLTDELLARLEVTAVQEARFTLDRRIDLLSRNTAAEEGAAA